MKQKNKPDAEPHVPRMVDLGGGIFVKETTALWLVIHSEEHGDAVRNMAGRMLDDIVDADMEAHNEEFDATMH